MKGCPGGFFHGNEKQDRNFKVQLHCQDVVESVCSCRHTQPVLENGNQQIHFSELVALKLNPFCLKVVCGLSAGME